VRGSAWVCRWEWGWESWCAAGGLVYIAGGLFTMVGGARDEGFAAFPLLGATKHGARRGPP